MKQPVWSSVRKDLRMQPLTEGRIGGDAPLYVERWVYQARKVDVSGIKCPVLITQLGGARVNEGHGGRWRSSTLPSQSILMAPDTPTSWHYSGPVDDVAFYFLEPQSGVQGRLRDLVAMHGQPMQFADALVAAAAQQLVDELHSGSSADEQFMSRLAELMLEQVFRVLTASNASGLHPGHTHFSRLQKVLRHINAHLAESLPNDQLAGLAGVSESHFRRMFIDATGLPPHRYVRGRRLAQARKLLVMSELPISMIARRVRLLQPEPPDEMLPGDACRDAGGVSEADEAGQPLTPGSTRIRLQLMPKSTSRLSAVLGALSAVARQTGWSDAEWARRSGLPKETLCRLRSRSTCDFATLDALARAVDADLEVSTRAGRTSADGRWPAVVDRSLEARLVDLLGSGSTRIGDWRPLGPPFFLAGLAVMLASLPSLDRSKYLDLAEALHPGATEPRVFAKWLAETPLQPARFLPMLEAKLRRAA